MFCHAVQANKQNNMLRYCQVARAGKLVQEIHIATDLSAQEVKNLAQSVLRSIV